MFWCVSYCLVHLGQFRYCMKLGAKRAELVQLMQKFVPRSRVGIFTTNTPNPPHWTLNSSFVAFLSVWVHLGLFCFGSKLSAKWTELVQCKSFCHKVASDVFTTNAPNRLHWTPDSSFVAFHSVWVHLGPFHYCTKLGAKWAELVRLMQIFVPQSHVGCFHNERTQSTTLEPKLIFCCIS